LISDGWTDWLAVTITNIIAVVLGRLFLFWVLRALGMGECSVCSGYNLAKCVHLCISISVVVCQSPWGSPDDSILMEFLCTSPDAAYRLSGRWRENLRANT
jgi:hypothetical protein